MNQKAVERINKLLALAQSPNQNEAEKASEMAFKLMEQYGISTRDLNLANLEQDLGQIGTTEAKGKSNLAIWEKQLAAVIAKYFDCISYHSKRFNHSKYKYEMVMGFVGHESNRITCEIMYDWLRKLIGREANKKFKSAAYRTSFAIGVVQGLMDKYDLFNETKTNETGLVIYDEVKNWIDQNMNMKQGKSRVPSVYSGAYAEGKHTGSELSLNKQFDLKAISA